MALVSDTPRLSARACAGFQILSPDRRLRCLVGKPSPYPAPGARARYPLSRAS
jgi:hypothetical protein